MTSLVPAAPETQEQQKQRFAVELLRTPDNPFRAAITIFGDDTGSALEASRRWPNDPIVVAYMRGALDDFGDQHFLPSKAEAARRAWEIANDQKMSPDERLKALRLYSDIRGFIDKTGAIQVNNNIMNTNKVMIVRESGSVDDWEQKAREQQAKLVSDAQRSIN